MGNATSHENQRNIYLQGIYGHYYFSRLHKLQFKPAPVQNASQCKHILSNKKDSPSFPHQPSSPSSFSGKMTSDWCGQSKLVCPCFHPSGDELDRVWGMSTHVSVK